MQSKVSGLEHFCFFLDSGTQLHVILENCRIFNSISKLIYNMILSITYGMLVVILKVLYHK